MPRPVMVAMLTMAALGAMPLAAHAQGAGRASPSPTTTTGQATTPTTQGDSGSSNTDGTLRKVIRGSTSGEAGADTSEGSASVDAADNAKANEQRTNSQAATSGQVNGRNALAPAQAATGPSGAPAVGTTNR